MYPGGLTWLSRCCKAEVSAAEYRACGSWAPCVVPRTANPWDSYDKGSRAACDPHRRHPHGAESQVSKSSMIISWGTKTGSAAPFSEMKPASRTSGASDIRYPTSRGERSGVVENRIIQPAEIHSRYGSYGCSLRYASSLPLRITTPPSRTMLSRTRMPNPHLRIPSTASARRIPAQHRGLVNTRPAVTGSKRGSSNQSHFVILSAEVRDGPGNPASLFNAPCRSSLWCNTCNPQQTPRYHLSFSETTLPYPTDNVELGLGGYRQ
ncbi:hypothetical protein QBC34DRAFT_68261 [Podospora aff. communis PSN243]|uniref:Uncharacterized protein n=1 Tax=Podospora aff. communis PSN243 TaxID=3040156 RepID=A0AAV9H662_9PEZI|nr:hypothetical protein QBC34DRAFT_68261 [Podospora aff. communis PSN243]